MEPVEAPSLFFDEGPVAMAPEVLKFMLHISQQHSQRIRLKKR